MSRYFLTSNPVAIFSCFIITIYVKFTILVPTPNKNKINSLSVPHHNQNSLYQPVMYIPLLIRHFMVHLLVILSRHINHQCHIRLDNMSSKRSSFLSLFVTSLMNRSGSGNAGEGGGSDILGNCWRGLYTI
jgi:hypothetical protein